MFSFWFNKYGSTVFFHSVLEIVFFLFLFFFYDSMMQCNDFYNVVIED